MKASASEKQYPIKAAQEVAGVKSVLPNGNESSPFPLRIQHKLTIGSVDDPMEHEADSIADKIVTMSEPAVIQRKCAHCEEKERLNLKPIGSFAQRKEAFATEQIGNQIQAAKSFGKSLDLPAKNFMESRFGVDFSRIRIHTDSTAIQLNRNLNAQAFATGNDVFFNAGKYDPESDNGKRLLAHELVHTIQQGETQPSIQKQSGPPDDPASGWENDQESFAHKSATHYLLAEHKVTDSIKNIEVLPATNPDERACKVTTEKGINLDVKWDTKSNTVNVSGKVNGKFSSCKYEYSVNDKGTLILKFIVCYSQD